MNPKRLLRSWRAYRHRRAWAIAVTPTWHFVDVPVINGIARLPDGRTWASDLRVVCVPVLDQPS